MYIKKSVLSGIIMVIGAVILLAVAFVYGFTEIHISAVTCAVIWGACIFCCVMLLDKIEKCK